VFPDGVAAAHRVRRPYFLICGLVALLGAGLLVYSQTVAFAWDEGFHLLTAQLIRNGKRPYLDFFFPQSPLNAYWNAFWFRFFGDTWRTAHAVAALCTTASLLIAADYVYTRFPVPLWRFPGALAVLFAIGFNAMIVEFGTVGQAYGLCLLALMAAFRFTVLAVSSRAIWLCLAAGLMAGIASGSTLLTVLAGPVMLLWILIYNQAGSRLAKLAAFGIGNAIPFAPVFWLYLQKPREVLFTVFQFNYRYRAVDWKDATGHDIDVLTSWLVSSQASMLGVLALAGLYFVFRRSGWERAARAEFYLCAWISVIMGAHIGTAHPTFERYYLLIVPFLSILALAGIYWFSLSLGSSDRPRWPVLLATLFFACGLVRALFVDEVDSYTWSDMEAVAQKVDEVTPPNGLVWGDEHIYFLTKRTPPTGMEHENSHKPLQLPDEFIRSLHILPRQEMERQLKTGHFDTVAMCEDSDRMSALNLPDVYNQSEEIGDCTVYWDKKKTDAR
jgi:hypothetical protein